MSWLKPWSGPCAILASVSKQSSRVYYAPLVIGITFAPAFSLSR
jgi:hypothetical protein